MVNLFRVVGGCFRLCGLDSLEVMAKRRGDLAPIAGLVYHQV